MSFFAELKRRNVLRVGVAYVTASWLILQVADTVFPVYGLGAGAMNVLITALAIGLPLFLLFSWVFEITPEGLKWEKDVDRASSITVQTGKKLDRVIIGLLTLALGYFAVDKFLLDPARDAELVEQATQAGRSEALIEAYGEKSIAVLPFADMSPQGDQEYFSDGIAEELLNLLAKIPELRVISRSSAFTFKGKDIDIPGIAEQLNVAHILEGSVRKAGNQVRITAQLIEARSDTHLWSETYDRKFENVFAIQDDIAGAVVEQLKITLLGEAPKTRAVDPEAYALFLQGRHFSNQGSAESFQEATDALRLALAIDDSYAPAWSELHRVYVNQALFRQLDPEEGFQKALAALDRAIELEPGSGVNYSRLGWFEMNARGDLAAAANQFERALALEPGNAIVLANAAILLKGLGRLDQAIELEELALQRDPLNPTSTWNLAGSYLMNRQFESAEAMYRKTLLLSPDHLGARGALARVLFHEGELDDAAAMLEEEPNPMVRLVGEVMLHHLRGNSTESDAALVALTEGFHQAVPHLIAFVHAYRNEPDQAFEWLRTAIETQGTRILTVSRHAPELDSLREDPRWGELLANVGFSEQQLAAIEFEVGLPE